MKLLAQSFAGIVLGLFYIAAIFGGTAGIYWAYRRWA